MAAKSKTSDGNYFENFSVGQDFTHAIPRTVTAGDVALYSALYGPRFVFNCSDPFAQSLGLERAPLDDLFVLHYIAGKSVTDISLNAIANLGYAGLTYRTPVYPGDTLRSTSRVTGLRQNKNGESGIVYLDRLQSARRGCFGIRALGHGEKGRHVPSCSRNRNP